MLRPYLAVIAFLLLAQPAPCAAQGGAPDPRFGIVETFVNPAAATEAGAGYTRIILRWDVIQPAGPADWKPANVPDPLIERELAAGRQVVAVLIGTPAWASAGGRWPTDGRCARRAGHGRLGGVRPAHGAALPRPHPPLDHLERAGCVGAGSSGQHLGGQGGGLLSAAEDGLPGDQGGRPGAQVTIAGLTYFWDWTHGRRRYLDRLLDVIAADPEAAAHGYYFDAVVYHLYFNPMQTPQVLGEAQAVAGAARDQPARRSGSTRPTRRHPTIRRSCPGRPRASPSHRTSRPRS